MKILWALATAVSKTDDRENIAPAMADLLVRIFPNVDREYFIHAATGGTAFPDSRKIRAR